jgi:hypothetical protein
MKQHSFTCLALLLMLASSFTQAQDAAKPDKIFTSDKVLSVSIEGPWRQIEKADNNTKTWPGTFRYTAADGSMATIPVVISRRGLTRARVCDFPPLRLDFDKEAAKGTPFRGAGNLKLVTHCYESPRYSQYYIKEYLAYRIYNLVTPMSFRVQGLDVRYMDGPGDSKPLHRFAFLIEDPDDVAKRNDLQKLVVKETRPSQLDPAQTDRYMLFQFLIANLDWAVISGPGDSCCHNARLIAPEGGKPIYPLPYDLDSSGLVNAHYAAPPASLKVRSVRDRLYRGFCVHNDALPGVLQEFRDLQPQIMALFEKESRLDERNRKDALRFLSGFYTDLEDDKDIKRKLIGNCRG